MYKVIIPKRTQKDLKKIDSRYKCRIYEVLNELSINPYSGKKLEGIKNNQFSYRVWPYRVIYEIKQNELVVLVIKIGHRQSIYK